MQICEVIEVNETDGSLRDLLTTAILEKYRSVYDLDFDIERDRRSGLNYLAEGSISGRVGFQYKSAVGDSNHQLMFSGTFEIVGYFSAKVDLGFNKVEVNISGG